MNHAEDFLIEYSGGFGGRFGVGHKRFESFVEILPPVIASLVDAGVGEHFIEEHFFGDDVLPHGLVPRLVGVSNVVQEEIGGEALQMTCLVALLIGESSLALRLTVGRVLV